MGRRPVKDKKMPNEYPQLAIRVSKENKKRLTAEIESVQDMLNHKRKDGDPYVNKNDVVVWALDVGLKKLRRR